MQQVGNKLKENSIILDGYFRETNRNGKFTIRLVYLALTRNLLMIASSHSFEAGSKSSVQENILEIRSLHPLHTLKLSIFKKTQRHALKLRFHNKYDRYFEIEKSCGADALWAEWCKKVQQLRQMHFRKLYSDVSLDKSTSYDMTVINKQWEAQKITWKDKYLYLGSRRENEDNSRPTPVPGLGPPEDLKLLCLKPQYFGCWEQAEHWVQCESSKMLH